MKTFIVPVVFFALASLAQAQNPDLSKWMCRNLADSGGYFYQGETVFGTQACRPIRQMQSAVSATPQTTAPATAQSVSSATPAAAPAPPEKHEKPLVFLSGTGDTHTTSGNGLFGTSWSNSSAHDQTMEMAKDFSACGGVTVVLKQDNADYSVLLNHEGNNHNQMAVMNAVGAVLLTDTAHGMHQSIKDKSERICTFIENDWQKTAKSPAQ
jgi:hypothetical protein